MGDPISDDDNSRYLVQCGDGPIQNLGDLYTALDLAEHHLVRHPNKVVRIARCVHVSRSTVDRYLRKEGGK